MAQPLAPVDWIAAVAITAGQTVRPTGSTTGSITATKRLATPRTSRITGRTGTRGKQIRGDCALQVLQGVERPAVDTDLKQQMRARAEARIAHVTDQISGVEPLAHANGNLREVRV